MQPFDPINEPKFILLYHAIDWVAGIVEQPVPFYQHEQIYLDLAKTQPVASLAALRNTAIAKLNSCILSDQIQIYGKPFGVVFSQVSDIECNDPDASLDYPFFTISRKLDGMQKLPEIGEQFETEESLNAEMVLSPQAYEVMKISFRIQEELTGLDFSFNYLNESDRNFHSFDKFGIKIRNSFDSWNDKNASALLFCKTEENRELFFELKPKRNKDPRGRPKEYHAEISLLIYLSKKCPDLMDPQNGLVPV